VGAEMGELPPSLVALLLNLYLGDTGMEDAMTAKYTLEVYEPGSADDVLMVLESETPFGAIAKGDFFNPLTETTKPSDLFRVRDLEHIVWNTGQNARHKICVYIDRIPEGSEARRGVKHPDR
jgi:hypothetical protein